MATNGNGLTPERHQAQIKAYAQVHAKFKIYADVLRRVLTQSCQVSFPDALVQSRAKTLSSYAEKIARKHGKYRDPTRDMTDLCGGRVIVQTTEQVLAVRKFIEANFVIHEADDKTELLSESTFGYRDMHYIVQLREDRNELLGITDEEWAAIDDRKAEIQVRTWVQHAWADTLHDRVYKNPLKTIPTDVSRTGALLAALLEESDRTFRVLADELDGMIANYTAIATKEDVDREIAVQQLVLENEPNMDKKPALAMKLSQLALACGKDALVVKTLAPYADLRGAARCDLLSDLGYALCRLHRHEPASSDYVRGKELLQESLELCRGDEVPYVPHLRKWKSLHSRVLSRLGWALGEMAGQEHAARELLHQTHEHESSNPYYLAEMLGFEMYCTRSGNLPAAMRTTIREAIRTCRGHGITRIELPRSFFTAGRLSVLLGNASEALGYYSRGIAHCLEGRHYMPDDALDHEIQWLKRLHFGLEIPPESQWSIELLELGQRAQTIRKTGGDTSSHAVPVLIIAGGAGSLAGAMTERVRELLMAGLSDYPHRVFSGGTDVGVPGCVGDVATQLTTEKRKRFELTGYYPEKLPVEVREHAGYDTSIRMGNEFSAEQVLRYWKDILDDGIAPEDVLLLGIGGGILSGVEYCVALGLGATVGLVDGTEGMADAVLGDGLWANQGNLYPLPLDETTVRAFLVPPMWDFVEVTERQKAETKMARRFHKVYVAGSAERFPANLRPWAKLDDSFRKASQQQAAYSVAILESLGFEVVPVSEEPVVLDDLFTEEEVTRMAELEHGRWNVERLRSGWRYGTTRDDANKIHDCLVSWEKLADEVRSYDYAAVRAFPKIFAQAGFEIRRKPEG